MARFMDEMMESGIQKTETRYQILEMTKVFITVVLPEKDRDWFDHDDRVDSILRRTGAQIFSNVMAGPRVEPRMEMESLDHCMGTMLSLRLAQLPSHKP